MTEAQPDTSQPGGTRPPASVLLPLGLVLAGRRVLVVGGGRVALRRVFALLEARADIVMVAPHATAALAELAASGQLTWVERGFTSSDLDAAWLAFGCTDDPAVNEAVVAAADERRVFATRADDASAASAWNPAVGRTGPYTIAVHASRDPRRAVAARDLAVAAVQSAVLPAGRGAGAGAGRVVLVGGGPGDPGLITVRGRAALAEADVVVADRLAPLSLLDALAVDVEIVDAAKVPGGRSMPQEEINRLLVHHASLGKVVVRLKGGDPFVFGRGGEEVEACVAAGIAVEVVPGVTSAISVPALAGIPVTHRGLVQGFTVVSGHLPPGHPESGVDWPALARVRGTLVVLMGLRSIAAISRVLIESGLDPSTPVAALQDGATAASRVVRTTLGAVGDDSAAAGLRTPTVFVVGAVASLGG